MLKVQKFKKCVKSASRELKKEVISGPDNSGSELLR